MKKTAPWEEELRQIPASSSHWARRYAWLSSHSLTYLNVVAKFIWGHFLSYSSHPITVKGWVMIAGSDPRWNRGGFHSAPACWYYRGKKKKEKKKRDGSVAGCTACGTHLLCFKKKWISSYKRLLSHLHARTHWLWKSVFKITIWLTARAKCSLHFFPSNYLVLCYRSNLFAPLTPVICQKGGLEE